MAYRYTDPGDKGFFGMQDFEELKRQGAPMSVIKEYASRAPFGVGPEAARILGMSATTNSPSNPPPQPAPSPPPAPPPAQKSYTYTDPGDKGFFGMQDLEELQRQGAPMSVIKDYASRAQYGVGPEAARVLGMQATTNAPPAPANNQPSQTPSFDYKSAFEQARTDYESQLNDYRKNLTESQGRLAEWEGKYTALQNEFSSNRSALESKLQSLQNDYTSNKQEWENKYKSLESEYTTTRSDWENRYQTLESDYTTTKARADELERQRQIDQEISISEQLRGLRSGRTSGGESSGGIGSIAAGGQALQGGVDRRNEGGVLGRYMEKIKAIDSIDDGNAQTAAPAATSAAPRRPSGEQRTRLAAGRSASYYSQRFR